MFSPVRSGARPYQTAGLWSWATCVVATPETGADLERLGDIGPMCGCWATGCAGAGCPVFRGYVLGYRGCWSCRETGGCLPLARGLAVTEDGVTVMCGAAPGRTELPVSSIRRSGIRPSRTTWLLSCATHVLAALGSGVDLEWLGDGGPGCGSLAMGFAGAGFPCPGGPSSGALGAGRAVKRESVVRQLGDWMSRKTGLLSRAERRLALLSTQCPPSTCAGSNCPEPLGYGLGRHVC